MGAIVIPELLAILENYALTVGRGSVRATCTKFMMRKTIDRERYEKAREKKIPKPWIRRAHDHQKGICPRCGKFIPAREMSGDHIVPLAADGEHRPENIACLHRAPCNSAKGARNLTEDAKHSGVTAAEYLRRTGNWK